MSDTRSSTRLILTLLASAALSGVVPAGLAAQGAGTFVEEDSNLGRGFDATKAFDSSGIDSVNTFNGNLTLSIPLGLDYPLDGGFGFGMALRYNSSVWDFKTFAEGDVHFDDGEEPLNQCGTYSQAWPSSTFNAGMGWELSLGRLYEPGPPEDGQASQGVDGVAVNSNRPTVYVGPDGARHEFFATLHDPLPASVAVLPYYTRDGSYLRLRCANPSGVGSIASCTDLEVGFPDGGRRVFRRDPGTPETHDWRVTRIEDAFGNHVQVMSYNALPRDPQNADYAWHLEDSVGRVYWIDWTVPGPIPQSELGERPFGRDVVHQVDVPGANGQRLVYRFHYEDVRIGRTCRDNYPWGQTLHRPRRFGGEPGDPVDPREAQIWVRRLTQVSLPDGTDYDLQYYDEGETSPRCAAGLLERADLPLGGATEWRYGSYEFPNLQECPNPNDLDEQRFEVELCSLEQNPATLSIGVVERTLRDHDGSQLGQWTYQQELFLENGGATFPVCGDLRVLQTTVTDPLGHRTKHLYSGYVQGDDPAGLGWKRTEYGLPFTRTDRLDTAEGPLFLSSRRLECDSSTSCSEVSRTYLRYELDPTSAGFCNLSGPTPDYCQATNARVEARRTVYVEPDGAEHHVHTESTDFDGLGHYRTLATTAGNLSGSAGRTTFTNFNPGAGTLTVDHDADTASNFSPPTRWLLDTYTERRTTEGAATLRQQLDFDPNTGFLRRMRAFRNTEGSPPGPSQVDVVTVFADDGKGNVARRERHGGEHDRVPRNGGLPGLDLGAPEYRVDQTWESGVLQTSRWVDPTDGSESLSIVDNRSIDAATGRVLSAADPAGIVTTYEYDELGRLTAVIPRDDLATRIEYDLAARPVAIRVGRGARAAADTPQETEELYLYDGIGRLTTERARLPGAGWSERITGYLGDGTVSWVTDTHRQGTAARGCPVAPAGTPARGCTRNLFHDAFGRPTRVVGPDGARTDLDHFGIRKTVTTQRSVATALGSASGNPARHEIRDFDGRLAEVHEFSAGNGLLAKTSYEYDPAGRLSRVKNAEAAQQDRLFFYDGRGFLASERHPEMASLPSSGLTSVLWSEHDSLGNPGRRTDADTEVTYEYDFAGRLIRTSQNGEPVTEHFYARSNHPDGRGGTSYSRGKLHQSRRVNRLPGFADVVVTETFEYAEPEGRLSRSSLRASHPFHRSVRFVQELHYDALGEIASIDYPACEGPDRCDPGLARRSVDRTFQRGRVLTVRDGTDDALLYASSISYDANGLATQVVRGNDVIDTIPVDPSGLPRPRSFTFAGPFGSWTTGDYLYDGRGDVYRIGADRYQYDPVGRLLEGEVFAGAKRQSLTYDVSGNLTSLFTTDRGTYAPAVDVSTNRLAEAGVGYSGAGRLTAFRNRTLTYDPLGQPVALAGQGVNVLWAYDAEGERVAHFDLMNGAETWTLRGPDDRVLRRYETDDDLPARPAWRVQDYVYQGGRLLATVDDGAIEHFHADHLGTPRLVTNAQGQEVSRHTYYPFGEEVFEGAVDHAVRRRDETLRFTGHERDVNGESAADPAVDDLDYMHARYYSPFYGRFLSVDPVAGTPADPQSWNRYTYAGNSPVVVLDPDGRQGQGFSLFDPDAPPSVEYLTELSDYSHWLDTRDPMEWGFSYTIPGELELGTSLRDQIVFQRTDMLTFYETMTVGIYEGRGVVPTNHEFDVAFLIASAGVGPRMSSLFRSPTALEVAGREGIAATSASLYSVRGSQMGLRFTTLQGTRAARLLSTEASAFATAGTVFDRAAAQRLLTDRLRKMLIRKAVRQVLEPEDPPDDDLSDP